ncbi:hypothetical protein [Arsukibacterium sp.]|uniref:hypothetical protein n=1 Tax=Arsukibacterium sp. TaxID=1977258 RepID=UPI001BD1C1A1|nr:hypothetical protein [Arsukibacterium sp.]
MAGKTEHQDKTSSEKKTDDHAATRANVDRAAAQSALSMINQQKQNIVKRLHIPWWQGPLTGLYMAVLVVSHAAPMPYNSLLVGFACVGIFFMLRSYTSQPVWVSGWRNGKTRALSVTFIVVYLLHYFGSMWLFSRGVTWVIPVIAISIFVIAVIYSQIWLVVWRKDMEADDVR